MIASFMLPASRIPQAVDLDHVPLQAPLDGAALASSASLPVIMQHQQGNNWCWAAVSVSIANYYTADSATQCDVASKELRLGCCPERPGDPCPGNCDVPWQLNLALKRVGHLDSTLGQAATFAAVQAEINSQQPIGCHITWVLGSGHFVAITGWSLGASGTSYVDIKDPFYGPTTLPFSQFSTAYQKSGDSWDYTYFTKRTPAVAVATLEPDPSAPMNAPMLA